MPRAEFAPKGATMQRRLSVGRCSPGHPGTADMSCVLPRPPRQRAGQTMLFLLAAGKVLQLPQRSRWVEISELSMNVHLTCWVAHFMQSCQRTSTFRLSCSVVEIEACRKQQKHTLPGPLSRRVAIFSSDETIEPQHPSMLGRVRGRQRKQQSWRLPRFQRRHSFQRLPPLHLSCIACPVTVLCTGQVASR